MSELGKFSSIGAIRDQFESNRYISDQSLATVIYLSYHMHKPIFLEGEPGVGKTAVPIIKRFKFMIRSVHHKFLRVLKSHDYERLES